MTSRPRTSWSISTPRRADDFLSLIDLVGVRLHYPAAAAPPGSEPCPAEREPAPAPGRTRTETLRFLRAYLPWGLSPLNDWKAVWRSTEKAIQAKRSEPPPRTSTFLTPTRPWELEFDRANLDPPDRPKAPPGGQAWPWLLAHASWLRLAAPP